MSLNTTLTLGSFTFSGFEIPEKISFGGEQKLTVHELVGGARVVDAMGRSEAPLEWSGWFVGSEALGRVRKLNNLRIAGLPLELKWSELAYTVVIKSFLPEYQYQYRIPYRIVCEVVKDLTSAPPPSAISSLTSLVKADLAAAKALATAINNPSLSSAVQKLDDLVTPVEDFTQASSATINAISKGISDANKSAASAFTAANGNIQTKASTSILSQDPLASKANVLKQQIDSVKNAEKLLKFQTSLKRMWGNLQRVNLGIKKTVALSGNLYAIGAQYYNDAMSWVKIAKSNKLTDPSIISSTIVDTVTGGIRPQPQELILPPYDQESGGVLDGVLNA